MFVLAVVASVEATAGPRGGGSGGERGRLGQVSSGIATATAAGSSGGGREQTSMTDMGSYAGACTNPQYRRSIYDGQCIRRCREGDLYRPSDGVCVRATTAIALRPDAGLHVEGGTGPVSASSTSARVSGYFGGMKVFESDGAVTFEAAVTDRWLRLAGTLTRFYERQASGETLTMTMPSIALGVRLDGSETTRVYLEAGVVAALTRNDPVEMDSSITGGVGGVHVEHALSRRTTLIGDAKLMAFQDDVRAASLRAGLRYRHVQASFSILDFNVGPALFGPEIGIGF